ncbi:carbohydrate ABC transporter permease [Verrucomicrobiota bacterium]
MTGKMPRPLDLEARRRLVPYLLVLPVFLYYAAFWLRPVLSAVVGSFMDAQNHFTVRYYAAIFEDPVFRQAAFNTLLIVVFSVTIEFLAAFGLALLINMRFRGSGIVLAVALIPMALPAVAVGAMWSSGLATYGWLNSFLCRLGAIAADGKIPFLGGGRYASMFLIILIDAWQVIPFMMIILLAGLQNLGKEYREAGYVFGASSLTVLRKITVPLLKPTIQTALVLRIISAIQIWLIIVMLFGYRRIPVLLEEMVFYNEVMRGPESFKISLAYSVLVAVIVSAVAVLYLRLSGPAERAAPAEPGPAGGGEP